MTNPAAFGFLMGLLLCGGWPPVAAAAGAASGHAPTRLQLCQREVAEQGGALRKQALRDCLLRRSEGEAGVAADCRRQLRIGSRPSAPQQRQLRDCEARALTVPSQQLPRRPVPRAAPASGAATPTTSSGATPPRRPVPPAREGA